MQPDEYQFHTEPYAHQLKAFLRSAEELSWALFAEMGTGKSKIVIDTAHYLRRTQQIEGLLIVAPKGCYRNWVGELETHYPKGWGWVCQTWDTRIKSPIFTGPSSGSLLILLMNVEAFGSGKRGIEAAESFLAARRCLFVVDESTAIKNRNAKRTKAIVNLGGMAPFRRILTGTPITQSPLDLYSQCAFLDPKLLGHSSYYSFRARYCDLEKKIVGSSVDPKTGETKLKAVQQVTGHKRMDELARKLQVFSTRVTKEECLDLPPKVYERREVELTKEQRIAYENMRLTARVVLEGQEVTAPLALTQLLRLHQIVCGFVKTDAGYENALDENRTQALFDVIDESRGKVIIWCNFRFNVEEVAAELREKYGLFSALTYYGETTPRERERTLFEFQNSPDCRFFVGTPSTAGYGLTLTAASTVVYYSNSFKLEQRLQSEDRAHRIGQTKSVTYVDLVAPGTIDERIVEALRDKKELANLVMNGGWKEML